MPEKLTKKPIFQESHLWQAEYRGNPESAFVLKHTAKAGQCSFKEHRNSPLGKIRILPIGAAFAPCGMPSRQFFVRHIFSSRFLQKEPLLAQYLAALHVCRESLQSQVYSFISMGKRWKISYLQSGRIFVLHCLKGNTIWEEFHAKSPEVKVVCLTWERKSLPVHSVSV